MFHTTCMALVSVGFRLSLQISEPINSVDRPWERGSVAVQLAEIRTGEPM